MFMHNVGNQQNPDPGAQADQEILVIKDGDGSEFKFQNGGEIYLVASDDYDNGGFPTKRLRGGGRRRKPRRRIPPPLWNGGQN